MLVLSRRVEEEIVFPHLGITLSVLQVRGRIVKIGIVAPQDVKVLASRGFVVHVARDGNEAFEQMHSSCWTPDFVLMDIQMPFADGTETMRRLRSDRRFSGLKIFAVTGARRTMDDEPDMGGWDGWFQKPVDLSSLVRRIHDEFAHSSSLSSGTSV